MIASRVLQTWGESESGLNERLDDVIARLDEAGDPTLAFLARGWEGLEVRLTTRQADAAAAARGARPVGGEAARRRSGRSCSASTTQSMESVVLDLLRGQGLTLGLAESLTGGLVAARLTAIPGASDVFRGGVVSYASEVKFELLEVVAGPGRQRAGRGRDGRGRRSACSAPTSGSAYRRGRPGRAGRRPGRHGVHRRRPADRLARRRPCASARQREQIRQFAVINALDLLRRQLELAEACDAGLRRPSGHA